MESRNVISLDYAQNPDLADIFTRTDVGKEACLKVKFLISEKDQGSVKGSITEIEDMSDDADYADEGKSSDTDSDEADEGTVTPKQSEPMSVSMNVTGPIGGSDEGETD